MNQRSFGTARSRISALTTIELNPERSDKGNPTVRISSWVWLVRRLRRGNDTRLMGGKHPKRVGILLGCSLLQPL